MGKVPIALVIVALQLFAMISVQADEQVRQLQEALRKRHLFSGDPNGEFTPVLVAALSRYQSKRGLAVTGVLDPETCASLGMALPAPGVAPTPFVVAKTGDVRGVNGELLPSSMPLLAIAPESILRDDARPIDHEAIAPALPNISAEELRPAGRGPRRARPAAYGKKARRETNPFIQAYQSVDHAWKFIFGEAPPKKKREPKKRG